MATKTYEFERWAVEQIAGAQERIGAELSKVIIGQKDVIEHLLIAVLCGGHGLITGAPVIRTVRTISQKIKIHCGDFIAGILDLFHPKKIFDHIID